MIKGLGYRIEILSFVKHHPTRDSYTVWFLVPDGQKFEKVNLSEEGDTREDRPNGT